MKTSTQNCFRSSFFHIALVAAIGCVAAVSTAAAEDVLYRVKQTFTVADLPETAKEVRGWFWMPEDRPGQTVKEFRVVKGPDSVEITRDPRYGRSWIYAAAKVSNGEPLEIVTEFTVLRRDLAGLADPLKTRALTEEDRRAFAFELRRDEKLMEVTPEIQEIGDRLADGETNPVILARRMFDYVIGVSDHYSKFSATPQGLCLGSAMECLAGTGDCCTDQHALFIALCRSQGIPCRLMYGSRLKPEKEGVDHDPGYRCWPNFYAPGLGWIPLDISSADTVEPKQAGRWFGGLDPNRIEWAEGRDFELSPPSAVRPDLVIRGWVEVDGEPYEGWDRTLRFQSEVVHADGMTAQAR